MSRAVLERDQFRCVRCGSLVVSGWFDVHHRVLGNRGENAPWNLITLCRRCHDWAHAHPKAARDGGWIVSRHAPDPAAVPALYAQPGREGFYFLNDDLTVAAREG